MYAFFNKDNLIFKIEEPGLNEYECYIYSQDNKLIRKYSNLKCSSFQNAFDKVLKEMEKDK